jgi:hypothetical protein
MCRETAPGLVQAYHRFKARGVVFVSLTDVGPEAAKEFMAQFKVPWPCGYGAELEDLAQFGAYTSGRMSGGYNPGYEVNPTLYLIGANGRVVWHDRQARPLHRGSAPDILQEVEAAIETALTSGTPAGRDNATRDQRSEPPSTEIDR